MYEKIWPAWSPCRKEEAELEKVLNVAEKGEAAEDADLSRGVEEVEGGDVKRGRE